MTKFNFLIELTLNQALDSLYKDNDRQMSSCSNQERS